MVDEALTLKSKKEKKDKKEKKEKKEKKDKSEKKEVKGGQEYFEGEKESNRSQSRSTYISSTDQNGDESLLRTSSYPISGSLSLSPSSKHLKVKKEKRHKEHMEDWDRYRHTDKEKEKEKEKEVEVDNGRIDVGGEMTRVREEGRERSRTKRLVEDHSIQTSSHPSMSIERHEEKRVNSGEGGVIYSVSPTPSIRKDKKKKEGEKQFIHPVSPTPSVRKDRKKKEKEKALLVSNVGLPYSQPPDNTSDLNRSVPLNLSTMSETREGYHHQKLEVDDNSHSSQRLSIPRGGIIKGSYPQDVPDHGILDKSPIHFVEEEGKGMRKEGAQNLDKGYDNQHRKEKKAIFNSDNNNNSKSNNNSNHDHQNLTGVQHQGPDQTLSSSPRDELFLVHNSSSSYLHCISSCVLRVIEHLEKVNDKSNLLVTTSNHEGDSSAPDKKSVTPIIEEELAAILAYISSTFSIANRAFDLPPHPLKSSVVRLQSSCQNLLQRIITLISTYNKRERAMRLQYQQQLVANQSVSAKSINDVLIQEQRTIEEKFDALEKAKQINENNLKKQITTINNKYIEESESLKEEIARLKLQVDTVASQMKQQEDLLHREKEEALCQQRIEYEGKVSEEKDKLKQTREDLVNNVSTRYKEELNGLKSYYEDSIEHLKEEHSLHLNIKTSTIEAQLTSYKENIETLSTTVKKLESSRFDEINRLTATYEATIDELKENLERQETALSQSKADNETKLELLTIEKEREKDELEMKYEDKCSLLQKDYEKQLAGQKSEFAERMEKMKNESLEGLSVAYQDIDQTKKSLEIKMRKDNDSVFQELKKAHDIELRQAGKEILTLRQEVHFLRSTLDKENINNTINSSSNSNNSSSSSSGSNGSSNNDNMEDKQFDQGKGLDYDMGQSSEATHLDVDDPISPPRRGGKNENKISTLDKNHEIRDHNDMIETIYRNHLFPSGSILAPNAPIHANFGIQNAHIVVGSPPKKLDSSEMYSSSADETPGWMKALERSGVDLNILEPSSNSRKDSSSAASIQIHEASFQESSTGSFDNKQQTSNFANKINVKNVEGSSDNRNNLQNLKQEAEEENLVEKLMEMRRVENIRQISEKFDTSISQTSNSSPLTNSEMIHFYSKINLPFSPHISSGGDSSSRYPPTEKSPSKSNTTRKSPDKSQRKLHSAPLSTLSVPSRLAAETTLDINNEFPRPLTRPHSAVSSSSRGVIDQNRRRINSSYSSLSARLSTYSPSPRAPYNVSRKRPQSTNVAFGSTYRK